MHRKLVVQTLVAALLAGGAAYAADQPAPRTGASEQKAKKKARPMETAFGREGDARKVKRVIRVDTSDAMRYFPDQIRIKRGDTVRFVVHNGGQLTHEMVLGTMDDLKKHAAALKRRGTLERDGANVAHVEPGGSGRIVWQFTKAGEFYYGCLMPGHFDAGMIGTIVVR